MHSSKARYGWLMIAVCLLTACDYVPDWMGGRKEKAVTLPGERIEVLPRQAAITPDEGLSAIPVILPEPMENTSWPQHSGIFTPTTSNLTLPENITQAQEAQIGDGEEFDRALVPRPVVADGKVFAMDAAGFITAHDAANIKTIRWESPGISEEDEPKIVGGGLAYDDGKLYAVSGRGLVAAIDAVTGNLLWRKPTSVPFRSAPKLADGVLYVVSIDSQIYAFNAATGDIIWSQRGIRETTGLMRSVSPATAKEFVLVPFPSGEMYALSKYDGRVQWTTSVGTSRAYGASAFSGIGGDPVIEGDVVFAVSVGGGFAVHNVLSGQKLWDYPLSSMNTPWITGDYVYVLTTDHMLVSFVKYDGRVRWATALPKFEDEDEKRGAIFWNGPVMAQDQLILAGSHGELMRVSAIDGKIVGRMETEEGIATAPVIAGGVLYLIDREANLHALK